jgi:hypothetical protein
MMVEEKTSTPVTTSEINNNSKHTHSQYCQLLLQILLALAIF